MGGVQRQGPPFKTQEQGASWLTQKVKIAASEPFFAGKLGTSECELLLFYLSSRKDAETPLTYPLRVRQNICLNAGVFPDTNAVLDDWANHMLTEVLPIMDGVAEWNPIYPLQENLLLNTFSPMSARFPARSLEPYYEADLRQRWTQEIAYSFAVVSPFHQSIQRQWPYRNAVWSSVRLWSDLTPVPHVIRAGYNPYLSYTSNWDDATDWRTAVESVVEQVCASGAHLVILGCGALSLPIAAALKRRGVSAIHTGGATQILFGVQGRRWDSHSIISGFYNSAWVRPLPCETPTNSAMIEGGCYW